MASKFLKHFDDVLQCPICRQQFQKPKLITCGHTFCLDCLSELRHNLPPGCSGKLICPVCGKISVVPKEGVMGFPPVVIARQVQTAFEEVDRMMKNTYCGCCDAGMTTFTFCETCSEYMCAACSLKHKSLFPDHPLVENSNEITVKKCHDHPSQLVKLFCSSCIEAICHLCATKHHAESSSHTIIPLSQAHENFADSIQQKINKLKVHVDKLNEDELKLRNLREKENQNIDVQKGLVMQAARKAREKIRVEQEQLLSQLDNVHKNNIFQLNQQENHIRTAFDSISTILAKAVEMKEGITICDFVNKKHELQKLLEDMDSVTVPDVLVESLQFKTYSVEATNFTTSLGTVLHSSDDSWTQMDFLKSSGPEADNPKNEHSRLRHPAGGRSDFGERNEVCRTDEADSETFPKEITFASFLPELVSTHTLSSGVANTPITVVGLGVTEGHNVICAFNTDSIGQVVVCDDKEQTVIYHRRKAISAFAVLGKDECGVALESDDNISRLTLSGRTPQREATCMTHRINSGKSRSNIIAITSNNKGDMIVADGGKLCVTGFDSQWRRPFILNSKLPEGSGSFLSPRDVAVGPAGELVVFDDEKKRLVVFTKDTKLKQYFDLDEMSSSCRVCCDSNGFVYLADNKQHRVVKLNLNESTYHKILDGNSGLRSPTCVAVCGNVLAVSSKVSFGVVDIKMYRLG